MKSGAIAQLGERFNGIEEVVGSIPSGSTIHTLPITGLSSPPFITFGPQPVLRGYARKEKRLKRSLLSILRTEDEVTTSP